MSFSAVLESKTDSLKTIVLIVQARKYSVRTLYKFTWERLATWINMTEVWPYRTSWIVLYIEETEDVDPKTLLKTVYQVSSHGI